MATTKGSVKLKDVPFSGRLVTALDPMLINENFQQLTNMRYEETSIKSIGGMTKVNTTALTNKKVRSGIHFVKSQPAETHMIVQAFNDAETSSVVYQNTTTIPSAGDFAATALHTDASGADIGNFSYAPDGKLIYCNGEETLVWGGDEFRCSSFINFHPTGTFKYDFTEQITNTLDDAENIATFSSSDPGIDSNTMLMLHLNNNVTDSSPTTAHTVTNANVTFTITSKFGSHAATFNGTNAKLTIPDDGDFNFSDGVFTIDAQLKLTSLAAINPFYHQKTDVVSVAFTSGSEEPSVGDVMVGAISTATMVVDYVDRTGGTWAGLDASGTIYGHTQTGTFQAEDLNIQGGTANVMTIASDTADAGDNYILATIETNGSVKLVVHECYGVGSDVVSLTTSSGVITTGSFQHVELVENDNNWYVFVGGKQKAILTDSSRAKNYISVVSLGTDDTNWFYGGMDEYRISTNAQHTSEFEAPIVEYSSLTTNSYVYVGSVVPLSGIKFYVKTANTSASTTTVQYWDGSAWVAVSSANDNTSVAGVTLAQTGLFSFTSTATLAKTKVIDETFLYWYKIYFVNLDAATSVYYVTLAAEMQELQDLWDGALRSVLGFYNYNGTTYLDSTSAVFDEDYSSANTATYADLSALSASNYVVAGFAEQQAGMLFTLVTSSVNTTAGTIASVSYWTGSAWQAFSSIDDNTIENNISFAKSGSISWNPPGRDTEFKQDFAKGVPLFYYKISFSQALSADIKLDYIGGIPAQKKLGHYSFSLLGQNRLWLCSDQSKNKNALIVGATDTSAVFNGDDSMSFVFGDDKPIVAGTALYTQYGSSLYDLIIICKEQEIWLIVGDGPGNWQKMRASSKVGCAAPQTMATCHVGFEVVAGLNRHVAIWQSSNGIYLFDGRMPHPIHNDISDVFDLRNTSGINPAMKSKSVGFFDENNAEYHWLWASGSSTPLDKEYVFDLKSLKWYEIDRGTGKRLQFGLAVTDTTANVYNYGFIDTGYAERLEYGNTFDGTAMTGVVWFGDMMLGKTALEETTLRQLKISTVQKTTGDITITHYGDSATTGTDITLSSIDATHRLARSSKTHNLGNYVTHSLKLSYTSSSETVGFEPIIMSLKYKDYGLEE